MECEFGQGPAAVEALTDSRRPSLVGGPAVCVVIERFENGASKYYRPTRASRMIGKGDVISVIASGGSGYGDVLERDPALVARDVLEHRVSARGR
jgi:N-methylhydantoinase B/oxoprolinase/acetone carboxylase alpha subunit